ncbi:MAG: hypothetical protein Q9217_001786 [Psora testacea]
MEITLLFAIATGSLIAFAFILRFWRTFGRALRKRIYVYLLRHVILPYAVRRYRFLGPWSYARLICYCVYLAVMAVGCSFRASSVELAGRRAGTLALINMLPLYLGFHLDLAAGLLGFPRSRYTIFHRAVGLMSVALCAVHSGIALRNKFAPFREVDSTYGFVVSNTSG